MIKDISIIVSYEDHPINPYVEEWIISNNNVFNINLFRDPKDLVGGDLLFLISCNDIVKPKILKKFNKSLVIHASDLPKGRGFSPHIWDILYGKESIFISLIEASEKVDRGSIWKKIKKNIPKHYIYEDIINIVNKTHIELMDFAIKKFDTISPIEQSKNIEPSYYKKRTPEDSELNIDQSIKDQFNLIRVCDNKRFPAFFKIHGRKYKMIIEHNDD